MYREFQVLLPCQLQRLTWPRTTTYNRVKIVLHKEVNRSGGFHGHFGKSPQTAAI